MDATPPLVLVGRALEAVLIGDSAAALRGGARDRALRDMIRRWPALPPGKRVNPLRKQNASRITAV